MINQFAADEEFIVLFKIGFRFSSAARVGDVCKSLQALEIMKITGGERQKKGGLTFTSGTPKK